MVDKDYKLYGTKILNLKTQEIGLLICLWENKFTDKTVDCLGFLPRLQNFAFIPYGIVSSICSLSGCCRTEICFATCVDKPENVTTLNLIILEGLKMIFTKRTVKVKPKLVTK